MDILFAQLSIILFFIENDWVKMMGLDSNQYPMGWVRAMLHSASILGYLLYTFLHVFRTKVSLHTFYMFDPGEKILEWKRGKGAH